MRLNFNILCSGKKTYVQLLVLFFIFSISSVPGAKANIFPDGLFIFLTSTVAKFSQYANANITTGKINEFLQ